MHIHTRASATIKVDKQLHRQTDRQTDRQADKQSEYLALHLYELQNKLMLPDRS